MEFAVYKKKKKFIFKIYFLILKWSEYNLFKNISHIL